MKIALARVLLPVAALLFAALPRPNLRAREAPAAFYYNSQANGNDFSGAKPLAAIRFTDVQGGVASFHSGHLILTPESSNGGADAFARDYVLREGSGEQRRDVGCRVVLPPNYRTGNATLGICLRFQADGTGLLFHFAPESNALSLDSVAHGVSTGQGSANLNGTYVPDHPVALEARAVVDAVGTLTATDLTTGKIIGFLSVPLTFGSLPAGDFGLVPWLTSPGGGSIAVASIQTYPVTAVVCDGDSLTYGASASSGGGTASPLEPVYPGVLQKLLGNRYQVINLGRGGFKVTQMNADAATRVDALLAPAEQPPIVILEGGTNDFGIDPATYPPLSARQAAEKVFGRLQTYWAARHAARADSKVIDLTNTPAAHPVYTANLHSPIAFNQRRDALNILRRNLAAAASSAPAGARPDILVDDAADPKIGHDGAEQNPAYFDPHDHTHLTDAGYAIKAGLVAKAVQQISPSGAPANP